MLFVRRWLLAGVCTVAAGTASAADYQVPKTGGLVGNSYSSEMTRVDDTSMRITARKRTPGDIDEVNTPGTSMYKLLQNVSNAAAVRAAVEAHNLGYKVIDVVGTRDLTQVDSQRGSGAGPNPETNFTFAQGHYSTDVELAMEITVKLVPGEFPSSAPKSYIDVDATLKSYGLLK